MKRLAVIAFVLMHTGLAWADIAESEKLSMNTEARQIAQEIQDAFKATTCDTSNDNVVQDACTLPTKTSQALILWRVSEILISKYYDNKVQQIQDRAQQINRSVRQDSDKDEDGTHERLWLDRGDMDAEKCQWDFKKRQACDYPAGFEEFSVTYHDTNPDLSDDETWIMLNIWFDNPSENRVNNVHITFHAADASDDYQKFMSSSVTISGTEYKYNEYYAWQNQTARDIRNGMYVKVPKNKYKWDKRSPFGRIEWEMDDTRTWDSQRIPAEAAFMVIIDATESAQTSAR